MAEKFIVRDYFKRDISDSAPVKFSFLGDNFISWFLDKIETPQDVVVPRHRHDLRQLLPCKDIIPDLGGEAKAETTLAGIYELMKAQNNGQPGVLLINGRDNLFYVRGTNGILRAVFVHWFTGGWRMDADLTKMNSHSWFPAERVFSR